MFHSHRASISKALKPPGQENTLVIHFESAYLHGKKLEAIHGKRSVWNGDASRVYVRKAQYHWGWDWGPVTISCGPWKPLRIETYQARINKFQSFYKISSDLTSATLKLVTELDLGTLQSTKPDHLSVLFTVYEPFGTFETANSDNVVTATRLVRVETNTTKTTGFQKVTCTFKIDDIKLWWPVHLGGQPLYKIQATLQTQSGKIIYHSTSTKIGFRKCRVIEKPVPPSSSTDKQPSKATGSSTFYFEINNRPTFCGGSNWIPADSYLSRGTTSTTYAKWLTLFLKGNQTMIRIWGGGIYEQDSFYEFCDNHGILVWQDFMFACGAYPAHDEFVASVEVEARMQVERLRCHPCVVLFAGNNEDYSFAESFPELGYEIGNQDLEQWRGSGFPARLIYERVLVRVVEEVCDGGEGDGAGDGGWEGVVYRFGSPWGGKHSQDPEVGDVHQWNVWHGTQEPYQNYGKLKGRFVSEFGMQGFPCMKTVKQFYNPGTSLSVIHPLDRIVDHHNKATGFARRIAGYVFENLRFSMKIDDFVYATQLMQAEAMTYAYRSWRREWRKGSELVGGALVWQSRLCCLLNMFLHLYNKTPVFPRHETILDYNYNPKASYYAIKREMAPVTLSIEYETDPDNTSTNKKIHIWASNLTNYNLPFENDTRGHHMIRVDYFDSNDGNRVGDFVLIKVGSGAVVGNSATRLGSVALPIAQGFGLIVSVTWVVILNDDGEVDDFGGAGGAGGAGANGVVVPLPKGIVDWPQPLRHLRIWDPKLNVGVQLYNRVGNQNQNQNQTQTTFWVSLLCERPVKGVWLDVRDGGSEEKMVVEWDDNMVDVVPGSVDYVYGVVCGRVVSAEEIRRRLVVRFMGDHELVPETNRGGLVVVV
ncbi:hypothetical protein HDU76_013907 [Blyttiomyces sp. JEL0837]|nr:hypothetical protein HDU76_013907 [Blyttiomyces sp. JEL0837]